MALATIAVPAATRITLLTIDVWFDRTTVSRLYIRYAFANCEHLDAQLVTGNSWITEERHFAEITADIGPADANTMNSHQRFARSRGGWFGDFNPTKFLRLFQLNSFQESMGALTAGGRDYHL